MSDNSQGPAPTYIPDSREGWWGGPDTRLRCTLDDKVVKTEEGARKTAARANLVAYQGPCGHWHLTSHRSIRRYQRTDESGKQLQKRNI
jgi:hypothetical protein